MNKKIYYPEIKGFGSYTKWNERKEIKRDSSLKEIREFAYLHPEIQDFTVVLSKKSALKNLEPGQVLKQDSLLIKADRVFNKSWIQPERYHIYSVKNSTELISKT